MATQYSNKPIVLDGLVYALDFGNQKSYVSGSSVARSLIYNPTPATFQTVPAGDYSGLAAAYSVRKVVSSYTGSAMMIQSASVSQSIGFDINGNLDTASIAAFAGSGNAFVKIWYDQSGNDNHVTQLTSSRQPQIVSNGSLILDLGKPTLQFDGSDDYLLSTTSVDPLFITAVNKPNFTTSWKAIFGADRNEGSQPGVALMYSGAPRVPRFQRYTTSGEIIALASNPVPNNTTNIMSGYRTNTFIQVFLNNVSVGTGTITGTVVPLGGLNNGRFTLMASYFNSDLNNFMNGTLSEIIMYTNDQQSNITRINTNINNYFNIYSPTTNPQPDFSLNRVDLRDGTALLTNQTFNGFSYDRANSTIMYVGETKGTSSLFTQNTNMSVVATTSSVGFGSTSNNIGRTYPVTGLKHVTLRFSSGSVDCFVNGIPVPANSVFPSGSSVAGGRFAIPAYTGSLGLIQVYNRPLTGDEIWNNYQLTAPRFNLGPLQNKPYTLDDNAYLFLSQSGITDPIITSSIDTFVRGLKSASLWDKMIAIYPFVGTGSVGVNLTGSQRWNLKEPSLVTYPLTFTGSWNGSTTGSLPSGSNTNITLGGITPSTVYPNYLTSSVHLSILSYDTPTSASMLAGTGMTREIAVSTLAGDYGTPAAAYSVRKVRTAYSGALMDVRRSYDNVTSSIGYVSNGDLDTGSLLDWVSPGRSTLPGAYSGLAAAYSLRRVSSSYAGPAIDVRRSSDNITSSIGFDSNGNLDTGSLLAFVTGSANTGSGFVAQWYDQSGNNRHATQTATGSQPLIVSSGSLITENGKPALRFDGVNDVLQTETFSTVFQPSTHFSVTRILNSGRNVFDGESIDRFSVVKQSSTQIALFAGAALTNTGYNESTQNIIYGLFSGSNSKLQVNNNTETSGSVGGNSLNRLTIGAGGDLGYNVTGSIQEFIFYTGSQEFNRELLKNNINNYYNIYTGSNHGFVARWYDQSGNSRHATQTTTGSQPVVVLSGSIITENSKPVLRFNKNNNTYLYNGDSWTYESAFIVNRYISLQGWLIHQSSFNKLLGYYSGPDGMRLYNNSFFNTNYIPSTTNSELFYANFQGSNSEFGVNNSTSSIDNPGTGTGTTLWIGIASNFGNGTQLDGNLQEIVLYNSNQSSNRQPISYGINSYYNIYPQTSSFATSSFAIYTTSGSVSASLNNDLVSGISTSGPLGLITVSRTGSNSLTIARNGVTSSFAVPASGALSTGIYLGAINNNGLALGNSPLGISFASVGTGLTNSEVQTLNRLVYQANYYRDPDALLFLQAAQITNSTQVLAVQNLVADLKGYGIWDKMKAVYPMVSDGINQTRAFQHKFNLKDPRDLDAAYRLTFTGGWVHSSTGALPNSTTSANTYYTTSTPFEGLSYYSRTNSNKLSIDIGVFSNFHLVLGLGSGTSARARNMTGGNIDYNYGSTNAGFWQTNRLTTGSNGWNFNYNGNVVGQDSNYTAGNYGPVLIGMAGTYSSDKECAFASVHIGLTNTEAANYYTAVQRFQTTLGRQV